MDSAVSVAVSAVSRTDEELARLDGPGIGLAQDAADDGGGPVGPTAKDADLAEGEAGLHQDVLDGAH